MKRPNYSSSLYGSHLSRRAFLGRAAAVGMSGFALAALNACGEAGSTGADGNITLAEWDYYNEDSGNAGFFKRFKDYEQQHSNLRFQHSFIPFTDLKQKVLQGAAGGNLPDLLLVNSTDAPSIAASGVLVDLTERIKAWGQTGQYYPGPLQSTLWQEKYYGMNNNCNCVVLYYNADMLDKAGVKPPTTWDELHSSAKKLSKQGVYGFAQSAIKSQEGTFHFMPFVWQAGGDYQTLDSAGAIEALQFLVDLVKEGSLSQEALNWTQADALNQFISGNAAMCENGTWNVPQLREKASFRWGVTALPKRKVSATSMGGENWVIPQSSKHIDAAWEFIKFTQEPKNFEQYIGNTSLPSRKDVAQSDIWQKDAELKIIVEQFASARPLAGGPAGPNFSQISDILAPAFQSALNGQKSAADALKQAAADIKPLLQS
jgi:multiple sugar transport system substrate-binding protein